MFTIHTVPVQNEKENTILQKKLQLDTNLDCSILLSSSNDKLAENLMNTTLEHLIDKISSEETYNDFGIALENINAFIKTWKTDQEEEDLIDMIIIITNKNELFFSNIGKTSAYLINKNNEVVELTESKERKKEFLFISNGFLANGEIVVSATIKLMKYLSKSDLIDGMVLADDIEVFNKNIKNILESEILEKNYIFSSLKYHNWKNYEEESTKLSFVKDGAMKIANTSFVKSIISGFYALRNKINLTEKATKNTLFIAGILIWLFILYFFVSKMFSIISDTETKEGVKDNMVEIETLLTKASQNIANPWIFERNIKKAEELIEQIENKELYLQNIEKLSNDINILKKQFNKIELYNFPDNERIYEIKQKEAFGAEKNKGALYVFTKKWVIGPIYENIKPKYYTFNELKSDEIFIDYAFIWNNAFLLTNTSKIVRFNKNGNFNYAQVNGQSSWEQMKWIYSYANNLYTLTPDNQINKHSAKTNGFSKAVPYLKEEDKKQIGDILDISIDGGFYLVKKDLRVVKFFSSPYRLEPLMINKRPENYNLNEGEAFQIKSGANLNYVYMLMNNKLMVFKTNNKDFRSTRSLSYIGQIEGEKENIIDFYIERDGVIYVLKNNGVYKIDFEITDNVLKIR